MGKLNDLLFCLDSLDNFTNSTNLLYTIEQSSESLLTKSFMNSEYLGMTLLDNSGFSIPNTSANFAFLNLFIHSSSQSSFLFLLASSARSTEMPALMSAICDARTEVDNLEKLLSEQDTVVCLLPHSQATLTWVGQGMPGHPPS